MGNPKYATYFVVAQFILFALIFLVLFTQPLVSQGLIRLGGIVLMFLGLWLILSAVRTHQHANAATPKVSPNPNNTVPLVESGLYARIRHPIYTGVIAGVLGAALSHGNLIAIGLAVVLMVFFTYKSYYEESLLRQVYPQYDEYMKRTGRFLPPLR